MEVVIMTIDRTEFVIMMRDLISSKQRHYLWQDDIGDDFLITKHCEVYRYSKNTLVLYVWSSKLISLLKKNKQILEEPPSDEEFHIFYVNNASLPQILAWGAFKRRPRKRGQWIIGLEKRLGHGIYPYNPKITEAETNDN